MSEKDYETLSKPHDISFHTALQRLLFTAFQNQVAKPMKMKMFVRISFLEFPNICLKRTKRKNLSLSYVMDQLTIASLSKMYYM